MSKKQIRKKEIKELNSDIESLYGVSDLIDKKSKVEIDNKLVIVNDEVMLFYSDDKIVPCLKMVLKDNFLPLVVIDMPAVKFIASGADLMRPGIKELGEFEKDGIVSIVDETHKKPIAIGKAEFSSSEIKEMNSGKVVLNLHHVGDDIWNHVV